MRKPLLAITAVFLILSVQVILSAPLRKPMRVQLNTNYLRAMGAYKRLESRLSREELRILTTIGILNGARQAEKQMERNVVEIVKGLLHSAQALSDEELIEKVKNIEKQLSRDHRALLILTSAMDLVTGAKDVDDFRVAMQQELQLLQRHSDEGEAVDEYSRESREEPSVFGERSEAVERLAALRRQITQQVRAMKALVEEKVTHTLDYLITKAEEDSLLAQASKKMVRKRNISEVTERPGDVKSELAEEDIRNNLIDTQLETRASEISGEDRVEDDFAKLSRTNQSHIKHTNSTTSLSTTIRTARATTTSGTSTTTVIPKITTTNGPKSAKQVEGVLVETITIPVAPLQIEEDEDDFAKLSRTNQSHIKHTNSTTSLSTTIRTARATTTSGTSTTTVIPKITTTNGPKSAKQVEGVLVETITIPVAPLQIEEDEDFPDVPPPENGGGGGGGLVGIITSLSGGEGGSDIGALIGALTGVISTLFGPGGLDIESLISTGTSLISGLLAGNKNFGTVLGIYIGTAFDGLSGGGGAVNNGQFLGNLLGTVYAQLSADPEDDDLRPNPLLFARNLISSFVEAKNRKESDEEGDDERRSDSQHSHTDGGGSDSGGFIRHIASHIVGSLVSLVLNAAVGASGGASHASASLFGGSSHKSGGGAGGGHGGQKY